MEKLAPVGIRTDDSAQNILLELGRALLLGTSWENVFNDPLWTWRPLYIAYTHDKLGTPDQVEDIFFEQDEAEILVDRIAREHLRNHPSQQPFYRFKVINWPLGALAIRDARDGFHRSVVSHLVKMIKQALQQHGKLPPGVTAVTVGSITGRDETVLPAYIDHAGHRIVLWEDCGSIASREESIVFSTRGTPPLHGLMKSCGEILIPAAFHKIAPLREGLAVALHRGKYGYIDASGCVVVPFQYEEAVDCSRSVLLVKRNGLWGALDRNGQEVIAPRFTMLKHDIGNEALRATLNGRHGYLSLSGELLVGFSERPLSLAKQAFVRERAAFIARTNKSDGIPVAGNTAAQAGAAAHKVLVDVLGQPCAPHGFAAITYGGHDEGLLCASAPQGEEIRHGYISQHGQVVIDFRYAAAENFSEGLAAVTDPAAPSCYGYIDRRGSWVITPRFDYAGEFRHGLAVASASTAASRPGWRQRAQAFLRRTRTPGWNTRQAKPLHAESTRRYGYVDRNGAWAIEPRYLEAKPFSEGLAPVRTENGWGYIDTCGVAVTSDHYQEAGPFKRGVARIGRRFDGPVRYGLVDSSGREIISPRYDRLSYPQRGLITARDEFGLWGCLSLYGNIAVPFMYREAEDLEMALAARSQPPHHLG